MTADRTVFNAENESRLQPKYAVGIRDLVSQEIRGHPRNTQTAKEIALSLGRFLLPEEDPEVTYTTILWNLSKCLRFSVGTMTAVLRTGQKPPGQQNGLCVE